MLDCVTHLLPPPPQISVKIKNRICDFRENDPARDQYAGRISCLINSTWWTGGGVVVEWWWTGGGVVVDRWCTGGGLVVDWWCTGGGLVVYLNQRACRVRTGYIMTVKVDSLLICETNNNLKQVLKNNINNIPTLRHIIVLSTYIRQF